MSMSSLESLSTLARQEPQGEETADVSQGIMDCHGEGMLAPPSSMMNACDEDDIKLPSDCGTCYDAMSLKDVWPVSTMYQQAAMPAVTTETSSCSAPKSADQQQTTVSAYPANSLIRQLLQNSPQYRHLLSNLTLSQTSTSQTVTQGGSPKLVRVVRTDGRSLPATPAMSTWSISEHCCSSPSNTAARSHVASRRLVNGYVNVDSEIGAADSIPSTSASNRTTPRDRPRPSTAPSEHQPGQSNPQAEPADRCRSFEVLDEPPSQSGFRQMANVYSESSVEQSYQQRQQQHQQQQLHRYSPPQEQLQTTASQHQQRCSPQQHQLRHSPHNEQSSPGDHQQLRASPQQVMRSSPQQQYQTTLTSSCPLQDPSKSPSHSPSSSNQNASQMMCAHAAIATRATQMVERLSEENRALRQELKSYYKKVSKLEKVERDIQTVNDAYETLAQHSQKRENLEKLMRLKLDAEITRLTEMNQQIQEHLEQSILQLQKRQGYCSPESELKKELHRKDALIAKFIAQNRELTAAKMKLESDISKQLAVVQETRARIKMLENVLAKQVLERRRLDRQHSASSEHQMSSEKCDGVDERNGRKFDDDFQPFRYQQCDTDDGISSDSESPTSVHSLIRQMQDKERHILRLEAEVARWEQKFLEEAVFRQLAVDAISIPKDAKIAALVQNSADTDKLLADARLEKLAYLKELHIANERCAHLEAKVKSLQADLAERESLVRVLQHHSSLSRASSISSLLAASCGSPLHSPQQHRSPLNTVVVQSGSKTSSGASSRQGSQLSTGSLSLSMPKIHAGNGMTQDACQMASVDGISYNGTMSGHDATDELKQRYWQV